MVIAKAQEARLLEYMSGSGWFLDFDIYPEIGGGGGGRRNQERVVCQSLHAFLGNQLAGCQYVNKLQLPQSVTHTHPCPCTSLAWDFRSPFIWQTNLPFCSKQANYVSPNHNCLQIRILVQLLFQAGVQGQTVPIEWREGVGLRASSRCYQSQFTMTAEPSQCESHNVRGHGEKLLALTGVSVAPTLTQNRM